jgi:hypothetical protein
MLQALAERGEDGELGEAHGIGVCLGRRRDKVRLRHKERDGSRDVARSQEVGPKVARPVFRDD